MRQGYSLIELAIGMVIVGLVVGCMLVGNALIHGARIRNQIKMFENYQIATQQFRQQYDSLPGDMPNAAAFFPGALNGNGNGLLENSGQTSPFTGLYDGELPQFFVHLSHAQLIEGRYDGSPVLGKGFPHLAINPGFGLFACTGRSSGSPPIVPVMPLGVQLALRIAKPAAMPNLNSADAGRTFSSLDAWRIDEKIDDGKANTGAFIASVESGNACADMAGNYAGTDTLDCRPFFYLSQ
jgi:prepilin-type N-terminal cleavage/methylation domain-containing protein